MNLGAVYQEKKDYADAIPAFRKALELNPDLPGAHGMLGTALLAQGYCAESIPHLEKAQADGLLGVALLGGNRVREAIDRLEAALDKRPDDPDLLYYLSQAHGRAPKNFADRLRTVPRVGAYGTAPGRSGGPGRQPRNGRVSIFAPHWPSGPICAISILRWESWLYRQEIMKLRSGSSAPKQNWCRVRRRSPTNWARSF